MRRVLLLLRWTLVCADGDPSLHCYHCLQVNTTSRCIKAACTPIVHLFCHSYEMVFQMGSEEKRLITKSCMGSCVINNSPELELIPAENVSHSEAMCCPRSLCNMIARASAWAPQTGLLPSLALGLHQVLLRGPSLPALPQAPGPLDDRPHPDPSLSVDGVTGPAL